jgi:hypothetical protein
MAERCTKKEFLLLVDKVEAELYGLSKCNAVTFFVTLLSNFLSKNYQVLSMFKINFFQSILVCSVSIIMRQTGNCIEVHKLSLAKKAKSKCATLKRIEFYIKLHFFQPFFKRNSSLTS